MTNNIIDEIKLVGQASSKSLAGFIIAYKLLGIGKDRAIICMSVLVYRKHLGDDFDFEKYIDDSIKNAPKPNKIDFGMVKNIIKNNL